MGLTSARRSRGSLHNRQRRRLFLENLESRALLATIAVTSLSDNTIIDGLVTLREAIQAAENDSSVDGSAAGSGADSIEFAPSLVAGDDVFISVQQFDTGADSGELGPTAFTITTNVTITGPTGVNGLTIERPAFGQAFRLFRVTSTGNLTLRALTLRNGLAKGGDAGGGGAGGGGAAGVGGAILNEGTLTLLRSTITGSQAIGGSGGVGSNNGGGGGGGVGGNGTSGGNPTGGTGGGPNGGATGASATGPGGGGGGGSNQNNNNGTATGGTGGNGGLFGGGGGGGYALSGGGASGTGTANGGNGGLGGFGGGGGGGGGTRCIQSCAGSNPGDGRAGGFGGGSGTDSSGTNGGDGGGGAGLGGAIFNSAGTVTLTQSTISGNTALGGSSGTYGGGEGEPGSAYGAGLFSRNGLVTISSTTIANNVLSGQTVGGAGVFILGDGSTATAILNNTIVADSPIGSDFFATSINGGSALTSGSSNLIESQTGFLGTIVSTADPQLLSLADRGGPTPTHGLPGTSPAVDVGSNAFSPAPTDQRAGGFPRIYDGDLDGTDVIDVGAVEFIRFDFGDAPDAGPGANGVRAITQLGGDTRLSNMGPDGDANSAADQSAVVYNTTNNEYFVVWHGDTDDVGGLVDNEFEVFGQRVNAATGARIGGRIRISTQGADGNVNAFPSHPSVTWNSGNNQYFVVWQGDTATDNEFEIFGQRLSASGALLGTNLRLSDMGDTEGDNTFGGFNPDITYNATTNQYLVVWYGTDESVGSARFEIFGQRLGASGAQIGTNDFRISNVSDVDANFDAFDPAVVWNSVSNQFLVAFGGDFQAPSAREVYIQRLGQFGAAIGGDVVISEMGSDPTSSLFGAFAIDVAHNSTANEYLVVWQGDDDTFTVDNESEIFGQRLASNGAELGSDDFLVSDAGGRGSATFGAASPSVAYNSARNQYLVAWHADDTASDNENEIYVQQLRTGGDAVGPNDLRVSTTGPAGNTSFPAGSSAVAFNSTNDQYLVVWTGHVNNPSPGEREIFGQRISHLTTPNYQTLRDDNGPRHAIRNGLRMGGGPDAEANGFETLAADGDDDNNVDDENGLVNAAVDLDLTVGQTPSVRVRATNTTGIAATLFGWIDFNGDGIFSNATERASVSVPNGSSNVQFILNFPVVPTGSAGARFARFRLATSGAGNPMGFAADGEVEDYTVTISNAAPAPIAGQAAFVAVGRFVGASPSGGAEGRPVKAGTPSTGHVAAAAVADAHATALLAVVDELIDEELNHVGGAGVAALDIDPLVNR